MERAAKSMCPTKGRIDRRVHPDKNTSAGRSHNEVMLAVTRLKCAVICGCIHYNTSNNY